MPLLSVKRRYIITSSGRKAAIYRRQAPPPPTSSFNWWPYPPWGSTASSSPPAPPPAIATTTTTILPIQQATPVPDPSSSADARSSLAQIPSLSVASNSNSSSSASSSSSSDIVTINGTRSIQPTESVVKYPKIHPAQNNVHLNMILIPVFVVLGVILGGIIAWFAYGCLTRKRSRGRNSRRRSELEVGPAYSPPSPSMKSRHSSLMEKASLVGGHDDEHTWNALDIQPHESERSAFLPPQQMNPAFLAPAPSTRKPPSASRGLYRAKTGASISVYSQLGDGDDEFVPPPLPKNKKHQTLNSDSMRRAPTTAMDSSEARTVSLSRRRSTCPRDDDDDTGSIQDHYSSETHDISRANTMKTTNTTRTGASTAMSFRIMEGSPLPTPLQSPPISDGASGFSWAGVGEMVFGKPEGQDDRFTNLPMKKEKSKSRARSKSRAGDEQERERRLQNYYGYGHGNDSHHQLPRSPPRITSPKLEEDLCFSPIIGQGQGKY